MDTGMIAIMMVSLLVAVFAMQNARQKGVKFKKWHIALVIILGIIMGVAPFVYLIWKMSAGPGPVHIRTLF